MKNQIKNIAKYLTLITIAILAGTVAVYAAGSLTPTVSVGTPSGYTLSDIYNKILNINFTPGTHTVSTSTSPALSFNSLTDIYNALDQATTTLIASNIATGTQIMGITGILQGIPSPLTWQTPDPSLALCYSHGQYEIDSLNCAVNSGWVDFGGHILGAVEYCQYLDINGATSTIQQNIWHLPTISEYHSITDFTRFNSATQVLGFAGGSGYWSSTLGAEGTGYAWDWYTYDGNIYNNDRNGQNQVRCVH